MGPFWKEWSLCIYRDEDELGTALLCGLLRAPSGYVGVGGACGSEARAEVSLGDPCPSLAVSFLCIPCSH